MRPREILEVALYADDLPAAEHFYGGVLGLPVIARVEGRHVFFRCGGRMLLLFNPGSTRGGGSVPPHGAAGPGHVAFAASEAELDAWKERLASAGITVEQEHRWPGGGRSLYLRDPAGNSVELATPAVWGIPEADVFGGPSAEVE